MMGKPVSPPLTRESIQDTYRLILGRRPNDKEVEGWLARADQVTPESLRWAFFQSAEFQLTLEAIRGKPWAPVAGQVAVFVHIPKTAGSSLKAMLMNAYATSRVLQFDDAGVSALLDLPLERRDEISLAMGHLTPEIGRHFTQRVIYFTTLRSPASRIHSYYRFIRRHTDHPVHQFARDVDFGGFLQIALENDDLRCQVDNGQVRWLASDLTPAAFAATPALFRKAIQVLFAPNMIFGISEEFQDFLSLLVHEGILPHGQTEVRENVSPGTEASLQEALAEMTADQRTLLDAFTGWDNLLYETARAHVIGSKIARGQASS